MRYVPRQILCIAILTLTVAAPLLSQSVSGRFVARYTVSGTTVETPFTGLLITVQRDNNNTIYRAVTDNEGWCFFENVPPGRYLIRAFLGTELLHLLWIVNNGGRYSIDAQETYIEISSGMGNFGTIVILMENVQSMR